MEAGKHGSKEASKHDRDAPLPTPTPSSLGTGREGGGT